MDSPGKNTGVGCHALLQGNFPTQGSNLGLPCCLQILYSLGHQLILKCKLNCSPLCICVVIILRQGRVLIEELSVQADPVLTWSSACLVAWSKLLHLSELQSYWRVRQVDGIGSSVNPPRLSASFHDMYSGYSEMKFTISVIIGIYAFKQWIQYSNCNINRKKGNF